MIMNSTLYSLHTCKHTGKNPCASWGSFGTRVVPITSQFTLRGPVPSSSNSSTSSHSNHKEQYSPDDDLFAMAYILQYLHLSKPANKPTVTPFRLDNCTLEFEFSSSSVSHSDNDVLPLSRFRTCLSPTLNLILSSSTTNSGETDTSHNVIFRNTVPIEFLNVKNMRGRPREAAVRVFVVSSVVINSTLKYETNKGMHVHPLSLKRCSFDINVT